MRHLKNLLLMILLPLVGVVLFASCDKDPDTDKGNGSEQTPGTDDPNLPDVEKDATIILAKKEIAASVAGGTYFAEYEIVKAHAGEKISVVAADAWVSNFDTSMTGAFSFDVAANEGSEARETVVTVSYRYAEDVTFTVKQSALTNASFTVEKVEGNSEYFSFTVNVYPENKTLSYIVMSASPSYIESGGLETDEALYQDDYAYFEWSGRFHGQTALDVMHQRSKMGNQKFTVGEATPGDTYIFYCYYYDYDSGARVSDIFRIPITVDYPKVNEVAETYFTFEYEIEGPRVFTDVKSSTEEHYYTDIMSKAELDYAVSKGYTYESYIQLWWATIVAKNYHEEHVTPNDFMFKNTCQGTRKDEKTGVETPRSQWTYDLLADTDYYIFAFNMDGNALCVTKPVMKAIKTGSVEMSDNELTISVSGVTAYRADVNITATYEESEENYRHAYVTHVLPKDEWKKLGATDAIRMKNAASKYVLEYMWGNKIVAFSNIKPNTEYIAFAFGYYGGVVTTDLVTAEFTTKSDAPGEVDFKTLASDTYYDPADLALEPGLEFFGGDSYKGWVVVPIDVTFTKKNYGDWFFENYDWTGRSDYYNDGQYLSGLIWQIEQHGSYTATKTYIQIKMNGHGIIVGIVCDLNGQYSKLYKKEYKPTYDGCGDPKEFAEWYKTWSGSTGGGAELQSLVVKTAPDAEAKANIIEVDASISKLKAAPTYLKASQRENNYKEVTPEVDALTATR